MVDTSNSKIGKLAIWCSQVIKKVFVSRIFLKMWQKPINPITSAGCLNKVRKSSVLFWHPGIAFNLSQAFCQAFEGHIHATEPQIQLFFFQRGLNFPWPHQKSKRFHARYAERDVLKKKFRLKSAIVQFWSPFLVYCLGEAFNLHRCNKNVSRVGEDVFLMLPCFLLLFLFSF